MKNNVYLFSIIIVNWNSFYDTSLCLNSIEKYYGKSKKKIFVILIDNASKQFEQFDGSFYSFEIKLIRSHKNLGFTGANNLAFQYILENISCEYILLLNNDTILRMPILDEMADTLNANPQIGALGVVNYYTHSPERIWQAGAFINYRNGKISVINDKNLIDRAGPLMDVDYVPGSCLMTRFDIVKKIGLFNDEYFAYAEEADFCFRLRLNGYRVCTLTTLKINHSVGKSSGNIISNYFETRNKLFYFKDKTSIMAFCYISLKHILKVSLKIAFNYIFDADSKLHYSSYLALSDYYKNKMHIGSLEKLLKK